MSIENMRIRKTPYGSALVSFKLTHEGKNKWAHYIAQAADVKKIEKGVDPSTLNLQRIEDYKSSRSRAVQIMAGAPK